MSALTLLFPRFGRSRCPRKRGNSSNALAAGLLVATVATVGLGVIAEPLLDLANNAALMPGR
ncbi:MAG: hypothetical protein H0U80_04170 [Solirubrobacterales bacterium]|nr:hypothetical protein [Solirubrobacterales bacterium]